MEDNMVHGVKADMWCSITGMQKPEQVQNDNENEEQKQPVQQQDKLQDPQNERVLILRNVLSSRSHARQYANVVNLLCAASIIATVFCVPLAWFVVALIFIKLTLKTCGIYNKTSNHKLFVISVNNATSTDHSICFSARYCEGIECGNKIEDFHFASAV